MEPPTMSSLVSFHSNRSNPVEYTCIIYENSAAVYQYLV